MNLEDIYHTSRVMFSIVEGELRTSYNDKRGHAQWLLEDFGIDNIEFQEFVRGYALGNTITLYQGDNFECTERVELAVEVFESELVDLLPDSQEITINGGVVVGHVGEAWLPIKQLAVIRR